MKTNLKTMILGLAVMALSITACKKQAEKSSPLTLKNEKAAVNCNYQTASVSGSNGGTLPVYVYQNWIPQTWTVPNGPNIKWEGQYNSFARPDSTRWFIGTIETNQDGCDWDVMAPLIKVKNISPTYLGSDPSVSPYIPQNVVGATGSLTIPTTPSYTYQFNLGYYTYVNRVPTPNRYIVIWRDSGTTWPTGASDPTGIAVDRAFVIKVTAITSGGTTPNFTSNISLQWKQIL